MSFLPLQQHKMRVGEVYTVYYSHKPESCFRSLTQVVAVMADVKRPYFLNPLQYCCHVMQKINHSEHAREAAN
jgi:hypothetical protein